jgi:predicted nucleotide-binding protein
MARSNQPPPKQPANLSPQQITAGIERLAKRFEELQQFDPTSVTDQYDNPALDRLSASIDDALVRTFGVDTVEYDRYRHAKYLDSGPINMVHKTPIAEVRQSLMRSKSSNVALLGQAIEGLRERLSENTTSSILSMHSPPERAKTRKVFIVHGHEGEPREAVAGFLRKIDFTPIILHEQSNQGRTIVEKFEAHADVDFAVVLLTPDDVGGSKGGQQQPRARQNVILELGYFIGKLSRKNVCAIKLGDLEIPSDIIGVVWTTFDPHGAWKTALAKELKDAGHEIDWNKVMGP